jgi:hypothetical protein
MEKISHILPPSRRVVAVDTESSQPVRPGAPNLGRPTSRPEIQDRVSLSALARERSADSGAAASDPSMTYKKSKESARAKAVEDLAEKFFNPAKFVKEGQGSLSEEVLKNVDDNKMFSPKMPASMAKPDADDSDLK